MGERRGVYRVLVGKPDSKNYLEDPGVDGRITLRWMGCGGLCMYGQGQVAGICECGNELSGSIKLWEFLD